MRKWTLVLLALTVLLGIFLQSGSAEALEARREWIDQPEPLEEYAFTFAFVGDTQMISCYYPDQLPKIYQWLIEHREEQNIRLVAGLGDITDTDTDAEWCAALDAAHMLEGHIPYTLIRGNHDSIVNYDTYLDRQSYIDGLTGYYNEDLFNTYMTLSVGTLNYLILNLDFGPTDSALRWACNVVRAYPDHNVIVVTHGYMDQHGQLLSGENNYLAPTRMGGYNDGTDIWNKLVKKFPNMVMVVCGHVAHPVIVTNEATGENGNTVRQVLIDPQHMDRDNGPCGFVALFHFSADGKTVQVENYATIPGRYYGNTLTFSLNSVGGNALEDPKNPWPGGVMPQDGVKESDGSQPASVNPLVYVCLGVAALGTVAALVVLLKKE